jgi:hypothetical protein
MGQVVDFLVQPLHLAAFGVVMFFVFLAMSTIEKRP